MLGCRPLTTANRVSHSKISVSNPSYLSLTVHGMEVESDIYDGWDWNASNWSRQSLYQKCSAVTCAWNQVKNWFDKVLYIKF